MRVGTILLQLFNLTPAWALTVFPQPPLPPSHPDGRSQRLPMSQLKPVTPWGTSVWAQIALGDENLWCTLRPLSCVRTILLHSGSQLKAPECH